VEVTHTSHWFPDSLVEGWEVCISLKSHFVSYRSKEETEKCLNQTLCFLNRRKWPATLPTQGQGVTSQGGNANTGFWDPAEWI